MGSPSVLPPAHAACSRRERPQRRPGLHVPANRAWSRLTFASLVSRYLTRQMGHVVVHLGLRFRREKTTQLSPDRLDLLAVGLGRLLALVDCDRDTIAVTRQAL